MEHQRKTESRAHPTRMPRVYQTENKSGPPEQPNKTNQGEPQYTCLKKKKKKQMQITGGGEEKRQGTELNAETCFHSFLFSHNQSLLPWNPVQRPAAVGTDPASISWPPTNLLAGCDCHLTGSKPLAKNENIVLETIEETL